MKGKGGRDSFREPRKRGFDDDQPSGYPPMRSGGGGPARPFGSSGPGGGGGGMSMATGPVVEATVKWFKSDKGFGFVELSDGTGDAFLHIGALQSAGHESVAPGSRLKVQVGQGQKGPQVTRVIEVDESTAQEPAPRFGGGGGGFGAPGGGGGYGAGAGGGAGGGYGAPRAPRRAPDPSTAIELNGTVKWFNGEKGFGFIAGEDGGKDVFIHISVLERAGMRQLAEGERVSMRVVDTQKGREAISIELDQ